MTSRRHMTWAYLENRAGQASELAQDALDNPELPFQNQPTRRNLETDLESEMTIESLMQDLDLTYEGEIGVFDLNEVIKYGKQKLLLEADLPNLNKIKTRTSVNLGRATIAYYLEGSSFENGGFVCAVVCDDICEGDKVEIFSHAKSETKKFEIKKVVARRGKCYDAIVINTK